jgi:hypothetical protein
MIYRRIEEHTLAAWFERDASEPTPGDEFRYTRQSEPPKRAI